MAILVTLKGPQAGRHFALQPDATVVGRQAESSICLESPAVSRQHACIVYDDGKYLVEDIGSSNGTFVNGRPITGRVSLTERDTLQIGPYLFALRRVPPADLADDSLVIRQKIEAGLSTHTLAGKDPAHRLRVVLEIAQHLGRTLDLEELLDKLLDHLMQLFPQADRALVVLCEGEHLVVRSQRARGSADPSVHPYSRTILRRALDEGVGILSEDVRADERFRSGASVSALGLHSLLCVPLIAQGGRRQGVLQLDRFRLGNAFQGEDLQLLTVVGIQVAVVLENASLHAELLREERLRQELAMAREIQQGFLPSQFPEPQAVGFELFARLLPAREVAGDLYDFLRLGDGRLAFFVGDVSGKGMPAALFMVAVRTLGRHLASAGRSPAETLREMNESLSADNPSGMFVTLVHGIYDPSTGSLVIASGGHPRPLLRKADGAVEELPVSNGRLLGYAGGNTMLTDASLALAPAETLVVYTDGFTEARSPGNELFGKERLCQALGGPRAALPLQACAGHAQAAVVAFTGSGELQDDMTLLLLRRVVST